MRQASITLFITAICQFATPAFSYQVPDQDSLELSIHGPLEQSYVVHAHYFDNQQIVKQTTNRVRLRNTTAIIQLESGYPGVKVIVTSPTKTKSSFELVRQGNVVQAAELDAPGNVTLRDGSTNTQVSVEIPRVLPNASEAAFINQFVAGIEDKTVRSLVSNEPAAAVDWQSVDAYVAALQEELGSFHTDESLDGWLTWRGAGATRAHSGVLRFERGICRIKLMVKAAKIVDVVPNCPRMPEDWYEGPSDPGEYAAKCVELTQELFSGSPEVAHTIFSPVFQPEISVTDLQKLNQQLQTHFGNRVISSALKSSILGPPDSESRTRLLTLIHVHETDRSKLCLSRADFEVPYGRDVIAKAHLASINIRESWRSLAPLQVAAAHKAMQYVLDDQVPASGLWGAFPENVQRLVDPNKLTKETEQFKERWSGRMLEPDWDLWSVTEGHNRARAIGTVTVSANGMRTLLWMPGLTLLVVRSSV